MVGKKFDLLRMTGVKIGDECRLAFLIRVETGDHRDADCDICLFRDQLSYVRKDLLAGDASERSVPVAEGIFHIAQKMVHIGYAKVNRFPWRITGSF